MTDDKYIIECSGAAMMRRLEKEKNKPKTNKEMMEEFEEWKRKQSQDK